MDVVDIGRNVDRMLFPVTAAIYQNGVEKRWTFEMAIGAISDQKLHERTPSKIKRRIWNCRALLGTYNTQTQSLTEYQNLSATL